MAMGWNSKNSLNAKSQSGRLHLDAVSRAQDVVTTIVGFFEIMTELILLDGPHTCPFRPHRITSQRAVAVIYVAVMHFVREFHSIKLRTDLISRKLFERI